MKKAEDKSNEQGYEIVPLDGDKQYFKPSNADVRLGSASQWEVAMSDFDEDD